MQALHELIGYFGRCTPYFRGKVRLLNAITPQSGQLRGSLYGSPFSFDVSDFVQRAAFLGLYERQDVITVRKLMKPGMTFVDAGANIGVYSALASRLVGSAGRVLAFEPSDYAYRRLCSWAANVENLSVWQLALSDSAEPLDLYVPPEEEHNHDPSVVQYCAGMERVSVPAARLDDIADGLGLKRIDFLKIDVEGHEPAVLRGCEKLLACSRISHILCELNERLLRATGSSPLAVRQYLETFGFEMHGELPEPEDITNVLFVLRGR